MNRKHVLAPLIAAVFAVSACGAPAATTQSPAATGAPAPAAKVQVRLATWTGVEEAKELQAVIDKINAVATTYQIVHEPQPADYYTKLQTNLAGGTAADLIWLSQENITGYADKVQDVD